MAMEGTPGAATPRALVAEPEDEPGRQHPEIAQDVDRAAAVRRVTASAGGEVGRDVDRVPRAERQAPRHRPPLVEVGEERGPGGWPA
jgi:hypothetical protein